MYMREAKGEPGQPFECDDGGNFIECEAKGYIEVPHDKALLWYLSRIATALEKIAAKDVSGAVVDLQDALMNNVLDVRVQKEKTP